MAKPRDSALPMYSAGELARMFGLHRNTVRSRLNGIKPCGKCKRGFPLFTVPKVAHHLVDSVDTGRSLPGDGALDPDQLPPDLRKDHWDAELKRQRYEVNAGDLWPTVQVIEMLSGLFKPIVNQLRVLPDNLEHRGGFSTKQMGIVREMSDSLLKSLHEFVIGYAGSASEDK